MGIDYTSAVGFGVRDPVELRESSKRKVTFHVRTCPSSCRKNYNKDWSMCPSCGESISMVERHKYVVLSFEQFFEPEDNDDEDWFYGNDEYANLFHTVDYMSGSANFIGIILATCDVKYSGEDVIPCDVLTDKQIDYLQSVLNKFGIKEKPKYYLLNIVS